VSRVYARREDTGETVLVEIKCDWCSATLKPGPHVIGSGWRRGGFTDSRTTWEACSEHAHLLEDLVAP
jgi:hypothetical protein